jgi:cytidine deaminase
MKTTVFSELPPDIQVLLLAASAVKEKAFNPYSQFFVGAALLSETGDIITGTNYESASYGGTICAERAALITANSKGFRRFKAIAIIARQASIDMLDVCSPCGICRQLLIENSQHSQLPLTCYLSNTSMNKIIVTDIETLMPLAFIESTFMPQSKVMAP